MGVKNKLKEIRMKEYMMSQTDFADKLSVPVKVYWSWENEKSNPTLENSLKIAKKLNKDIKDIWYLED
ncbi:helix-turn-helix transcriptional regulator [Clostridium beijerinckii]|uniref:Helix-turn-helix domain-containing protein n=1 Tax=Clostridium beijerinckii TaxID=1520 RepID=A0A7X9SN01_CLOBE|nr:helix-turn-helix domain-containing protein [Clostridium beijerinckii]